MSEGAIISLAGTMLPIVLVPTIITLIHRCKRREWQHKERLRAMELGMPHVTEAEPRLGGGTVTAIGAGVPAASVLSALSVTAGVSESHPDYIAIIAVAWGCAFLISTAALISAAVLGSMVLRGRRSTEVAESYATAKATMEPDAYDVVSSRG
jgi:hypothetical protein